MHIQFKTPLTLKVSEEKSDMLSDYNRGMFTGAEHTYKIIDTAQQRKELYDNFNKQVRNTLVEQMREKQVGDNDINEMMTVLMGEENKGFL